MSTHVENSGNERALKDFGQVQFGAGYGLISLKQQERKQTSRKHIDFVTESAFLDERLPGIQLYQQQLQHNLCATENRFCCRYITPCLYFSAN